MVKFFLLPSVLTTSSCGVKTTDKMPKKKTRAQVSLRRYMGAWYENACVPHSFEKGLVGAPATCTKLPNGKIEVVNQGFKGGRAGKQSMAKAWARIPNPNEPGQLKGCFLLPSGAVYLMLHLNEDNYSYALVGSRSPNDLCILSQPPQMHDSTFNHLVAKAEETGYNPQKLERVLQPVAQIK